MTIADVIPLFLQTTITIKVTTDEMRIAWRNRADRIDALAKSLLDEGRSNEK
jgi:hypothetical protein